MFDNGLKVLKLTKIQMSEYLSEDTRKELDTRWAEYIDKEKGRPVTLLWSLHNAKYNSWTEKVSLLYDNLWKITNLFYVSVNL